MRLNHTLLTLALLIAPLISQGSFISPQQAYGNTSATPIDHMFTQPMTRTQQADDYFLGRPGQMVTSMSLRGGRNNLDATARSGFVQIDMGVPLPSNMALTFFDQNYKPGTRTNVFPRTQVNLPDLRAPTGNNPPPFNVNFTLATPFAHGGTDWLMWDLMTDGTTGGLQKYKIDNFSGLLPSITYGLEGTSGTGCIGSSNKAFLHAARVYSYPDVVMTWSGYWGPLSSVVFGFAGVSDPNIDIGLCKNLRTDATVFLGANTTNIRGSSSGRAVFPWSSAYAGVKVYSQLYYDKSGSAVLSNQAWFTMPLVPGSSRSPRVNGWQIWSSRDHGPKSMTAVDNDIIPVLYGTN